MHQSLRNALNAKQHKIKTYQLQANNKLRLFVRELVLLFNNR